MPDEVYLPSEIAIAADVPLEQVVAAVGGLEVYVPHHAAVLLGRQLKASNGVARLPLFATVYAAADGGRALRIPLTVAGALQAAMLAALVVGSFGTVGGVGMSAAVVQPDCISGVERPPGKFRPQSRRRRHLNPIDDLRFTIDD